MQITPSQILYEVEGNSSFVIENPGINYRELKLNSRTVNLNSSLINSRKSNLDLRIQIILRH